MINPQVYMYAGAFQSWYKIHKGKDFNDVKKYINTFKAIAERIKFETFLNFLAKYQPGNTKVDPTVLRVQIELTFNNKTLNKEV